MKINIKKIRKQEITIEKCGLLSLVSLVDLKNEFISYEIRSGERTLLETCSLEKAVAKYNELV